MGTDWGKQYKYECKYRTNDKYTRGYELQSLPLFIFINVYYASLRRQTYVRIHTNKQMSVCSSVRLMSPIHVSGRRADGCTNWTYPNISKI